MISERQIKKALPFGWKAKVSKTANGVQIHILEAVKQDILKMAYTQKQAEERKQSLSSLYEESEKAVYQRQTENMIIAEEVSNADILPNKNIYLAKGDNVKRFSHLFKNAKAFEKLIEMANGEYIEIEFGKDKPCKLVSFSL